MAFGRSIHIGVNRVDPDHYGAGVPVLKGCAPDAEAMHALATTAGFQASAPLIDDAATTSAVTTAIAQAAAELRNGDILLITYSGHGAQVPDKNSDEEDGLDETWCLYDRMLVDDELYSLWGMFEAGVRILVLSDSCASGTVTKIVAGAMSEIERETHYLERRHVDVRPLPVAPRHRRLPIQPELFAYDRHAEQYDSIQTTNPQGDRVGIGASVLLMAACQDNQFAGDNDGGGTFTVALTIAWRDGQFKGNYSTFLQRIRNMVANVQSPNYYVIGASNPTFEKQNPFTI